MSLQPEVRGLCDSASKGACSLASISEGCKDGEQEEGTILDAHGHH